MKKKKSTVSEEVSISQFKATCLALLDRVKRTKRPLLVLRKGEPIAQVVPPPPPARPPTWLGSFTGTGEIKGDIMGPASDSSEWEALGA
jgi:antitoxin (DNA-binding transcriptional repressor) of toxin-antitoxin stability system